MNVVAFDTETRGLDWFDPEQQAFLASWADADGEYVADLSDGEQAQRFIQALDSADTLVCHNLSFDVHQVRATLGWDALANGHALHDTDLISRVLYPEGQRKGERGGHGLKNLAETLLDPKAKDAEDAIKAMGKAIGLNTLKQNGAYWDVWRAYPEEMEHYAKMDARYTYDLYVRWQEQAAANSVYQLERAVAPVLIRAEEKGVAIDLVAAAELRGVYGPQAEELHDRLVATLGDVLEGEGSRDGLRDALLEHGIPLHRKTEHGVLRTDKFALQEFEDDFDVIANLMDWRRCQRFLDTYLDPMLNSGGELHTGFYQCAAWTGRMSSRRPNMQNLPKRAGKEVRSPIVPREGHAFVVCDYDGIEARLLAYYMADEDYRQFFREGLDPHAWMAAQIHGGEMSEYAPGEPKRELRDEAKNTLFAITYGAGAPRVADMNKIDKDEAKRLIAKIKGSLPKYRRLMGRIRKKIEAEGHVNTLFGRKQVVNKDKAYVGLNALIQGSAADIMKQGLVNVDAAVRDLGGQPLLVVHDEVVVEVPIENADEALRRTKQAMTDAYDLDPPLGVSGSVVTTNYADA